MPGPVNATKQKSKAIETPTLTPLHERYSEEHLDKTREMYGNVLGHDTVADNMMSLYMKSVSTSVQTESGNAEWLSHREIPETVVEAKINDAYAKIGRTETLSSSQKRKRKKAFAEKSDLQSKLQNEIKEVALHREEATLRSEAELALDKTRDTKDLSDKHAELTRNWNTYYDRTRTDANTGDRSARFDRMASSQLKSEGSDAFTEITKADFKEFEYSDDKDFVANFAVKYEKLLAFASADQFVEDLNRTRDHLSQSHDAFLVRAKIRLAKELLATYEAKMKVMSSPYYTLLAGKDFDSIPPEELDRIEAESNDHQFKEYLSLVKEAKAAKFGRKDKTTDRIRQYVEEDKQEDLQKNLDALSEFEALITDANAYRDVNVLAELINTTAIEKANAALPEMTHARMRTEIPRLGSGLGAIFAEDIRDINVMVEDLLEGKTVNGMTMPESLKEEMNRRQEALMAKQLQISRENYALDLFMDVQFKMDLSNPLIPAETRAKMTNIDAAVKKFGYRMGPLNRTHLNEFSMMHNDFAAFRCDNGLILSKGTKVWDACMAEKDKVFEDGSITFGGETLRYPATPSMDEFKDKEIAPAEGVTEEEVRAAWQKLHDVIKESAGYSSYMKENSAFVSGIPVLDLTQWYPDNLAVRINEAREEFKSKVKLSPSKIERLSGVTVTPAQAGEVNLDRKIGHFWMFEVSQYKEKHPVIPGMYQTIAQKYKGGAYKDSSFDQDISFVDGKWKCSGLNKARLLSLMADYPLGIGLTMEQVDSLFEKLSASVKKDLNTGNEDAVKEANDSVTQGMKDLKLIYLDQLRRLEHTYGTLITTMHPEDFIRQIGANITAHVGIIQDTAQLMTDADFIFDYEHSEEDREFKRLADYYFRAFTALSAYGGQSYAAETSKKEIRFDMKYYNKEMSLASTEGIGGPSMTPEEETRYKAHLRERAAEGKWTGRLRAGDLAPETP